MSVAQMEAPTSVLRCAAIARPSTGSRGCIPGPWHVFSEFARQIWMGCEVTFGPCPATRGNQTTTVSMLSVSQ